MLRIQSSAIGVMPQRIPVHPETAASSGAQSLRSTYPISNRYSHQNPTPINHIPLPFLSNPIRDSPLPLSTRLIPRFPLLDIIQYLCSIQDRIRSVLFRMHSSIIFIQLLPHRIRDPLCPCRFRDSVDCCNCSNSTKKEEGCVFCRSAHYGFELCDWLVLDCEDRDVFMRLVETNIFILSMVKL